MLIHTAYAYCHLYRWRIEICFYRGFFFFRCIILTSVCFHQDETCITRAQVVNLAWTAHDTASAGISWEGSAAREHQTGVSGSLLLFPVLPWRLSCNITCRFQLVVNEKNTFSVFVRPWALWVTNPISSREFLVLKLFLNGSTRHTGVYVFPAQRLHMLLS